MKGVSIVILLLLLPLVTLSYMKRRLILKNIKFSMSTITASSSSSSSEIASIFSNLNLNVNPNPVRCYTDAHAHLIHDQFQGEEDSIVKKCQEYGLQHIIVNGLEPKSNRDVIELCNKYHPILLPAIGIYPLDAACLTIQKNPSLWTASFEPPEPFNVDEEIDFIEEMAKQKKIIALGECGLDKYYLKDDETFAEQERVLRKLMRVAKKYDLPIILHTRKAEERVLELLLEEGILLLLLLLLQLLFLLLLLLLQVLLKLISTVSVVNQH